MATYPKHDLPAVPSDLELRLQSEPYLERAHVVSEDSSYFFAVAHTAIRLATDVSIDTPQFRTAVDTGVRVFEAVGHQVQPERTYGTVAERAMVFGGAMAFADSVRSDADFLRMIDAALGHMRDDTPLLSELLEEVVGRYTGHDAVATRFALSGAAAIRGMQIFVDRRLEAAVA